MVHACMRLYKTAEILTDKVLPNYMSRNDINEFKNEKILGRLRECRKIFQELKLSNQSLEYLHQNNDLNQIKSDTEKQRNRLDDRSLKRIFQ